MKDLKQTFPTIALFDLRYYFIFLYYESTLHNIDMHILKIGKYEHRRVVNMCS